MNNRLLQALVCTFALGAAACRPIVWVHGDSITNLYCDNLQTAHPEWIVVCQGQNGEKTADGLIRMTNNFATVTPKPNIVVIEEGINDADTGVDPTVTESNLAAMVSLVVNNNAVPILDTSLVSDSCRDFPDQFGCFDLQGNPLTPCPPLVCQWDDWIRAQDPPLTVCDVTIPGNDFADIVHPNEDGQNVIANAVAACITSILPTTTSTTSTTSSTTTTIS